MTKIELWTGMYPYQKDAYDKLKKLKVGALYMEMGTGKTRTTLELISLRLRRGKIQRVLWFCPCSVRANLAQDLIVHTGEVPGCIRIVGTESISGSDRVYLECLEYVADGQTMLVVDESNMVKNHRAKRTGRICELSKKCTYKIILNGTPVSRNEADLFAQWYILDPEILGYKSYFSFAANHLEFWTVKMPNGKEVQTNKVKNVLHIPYLTEKIALYTYQIKKSETGVTLPGKHYLTECFTLPEEQRGLYNETKMLFLSAFVNEADDTAIYKMFTALAHVSSGRRVTSSLKEKMETEDLYSDIEDNPRIEALERVLEQIGSEKAVIFAKYAKEAEEIAELIRRRGGTSAFYTGKLTYKKRIRSLQAFRGDTQYLIANKQCGAYGLNLQFCRNIVFYDNDFDFATRAQAEDRIHRIGQEQECYIYDICGNGTLDEFILDNLMKKENMVEAFKKYIQEIKNKELKGKKFVDKKTTKTA